MQLIWKNKELNFSFISLGQFSSSDLKSVRLPFPCHQTVYSLTLCNKVKIKKEAIADKKKIKEILTNYGKLLPTLVF